MDKNNIPLVKAAFIKQFETTLLNNGISAKAYFKKVNLPLTNPDPESLLPEKPFWELINIVAINENIADFGSQVAQTTPWHKVSSLTPLLQSCVSLKELIDKFSRIVASQSTVASFSLKQDDTGFLFYYTGTPPYKHDIQMELYRITSMIQFVQLATGARWFPDTIHLMMHDNRMAKSCNFFKHSRLIFSCSSSAISLESGILHLPVNMDIPDNRQAKTGQDYNINTDFCNAIRQVMSVYVQSQQCSIDEIANLAGISVRTLQRRLNDYNLKFNELLNQAKFLCAKEKLITSKMQISEIAHSLGYSDAANFTRAFHRWAGVSPKVFRQQNEKPSLKSAEPVAV